MRLTLAALLAAAFAAGASPAAACGAYACWDEALASDAYPPRQNQLPPDVQEQVQARDGRGLSLAGFYNDPAVAMAHYENARPVYVEPAPRYVEAPPAPDYVEAPPAPEPWVEGGPYRRHHGPHVIVSPYGRHAYERHGRHHVD